MSAVAVVTPPKESVAARVRALQAHARALAQGDVSDLEREMTAFAARLVDISNGGEAYGPGVRDLCSRLAEDVAAKAKTLSVINGRTTP